MISIECETTLYHLGRQLRALRLERNDRQTDFAARLGVSTPTLRKMEQGDPTVAIGTWIDAFWVVGRLEDLVNVLAPKKSLFDQYENKAKIKSRIRASKK